MTRAEYTSVEAATIDLIMSFALSSRRQASPHVPLTFQRQLTNSRREKSRTHGIRLLQDIVHEFAAPLLTTNTPLLLITLNGWTELPDGQAIAGGRTRFGAGWRSEWSSSTIRQSAADQIGESASGWWSVSPRRVRRSEIEYAVPVHGGVTRALLRILPDSWEQMDTGRVTQTGRPIRKAAFWFDVVTTGPTFNAVVGPHGRRVPGPGRQNSIYYWPRGGE